MTNVNPETGVAYGVVALHSLADWVFDEFFYQGRSLTYEACAEEYRAEHGIAAGEDLPDEWHEGYEFDEEEYELETDGMKLGLSYLGGAPLVWVFQSSQTTDAPACSPCVPGAGDLDSIGGASSGGNVHCYTLPPEWFARGQ